MLCQRSVPVSFWHTLLRIFLALLLTCLVHCLPASAVRASVERPVNFIFLVDVSGSMVSRSTMVKASDGSEISLFEALRNALKQMVSEGRLIGPASRVIFITFGTDVKEMADWPTRVESDFDRQALAEKISSPSTLSADKHGDTYMGGAVKLALERAGALLKEGDPCTTTFILMLTDGWDEPPAGARVKVREVARSLLERKKQVQSKVGVDTWQVRVIGLQRLPDRKSGTTTAKELAGLLGGQFIDVNSQSGGTVSDRIFTAVKQTVESIKGEIKLGIAGGDQATVVVSGRRPGLKNGIVDFGTVDGNGGAAVAVPFDLHSCYPEEIQAVTNCSEKVPQSVQKAHLGRLLTTAGGSKTYQLVSSLSEGAVSVALDADSVELAPKVPGRTYEEQSAPSNLVPIKVHAHSGCPAGHFLGFFKIESTAKVPEFIPYVLSVPMRLFVEPETVKARLKKQGFFFTEGTTGELSFRLKQSSGARRNTVMDIQLMPREGQMTQSETGSPVTNGEMLKTGSLNQGKPISLTFDTQKSESMELKIPVTVEAGQLPGKYKGTIAVKVLGTAESQAPSEIPYEIEVKPSPWEEVDQLAIPILVIFLLVIGLCTILWLSTLKQRRP